ncbi:unnamed protein product [Caenorhabditis brenneri]
MRPNLLALILLFFTRQLLETSTPLILDSKEKIDRDIHFVVFDFIYLATIGIALNSQKCKEKSEFLFWMGIFGLAEMGSGWFFFGIKHPTLLYLFSFFSSIGPVFSICLIVDKHYPNGESDSIWSLVLLALLIMMGQVPRSLLVLLFAVAVHVGQTVWEAIEKGEGIVDDEEEEYSDEDEGFEDDFEIDFEEVTEDEGFEEEEESHQNHQHFPARNRFDPLHRRD